MSVTDIVERRTREQIMTEWDAIRAKIAAGCANDGPRLWLEGVLDDADIEIERLRSALAAARDDCAKVRKAAREGTLG